ncbi:MAG: hypothetical protein QOD44_3184 [Solirubrobacteraceae bacterium]|jgi:hypothetical protein|nr:hypothetical protein [Solirubrobacteraceae bacterium]
MPETQHPLSHPAFPLTQRELVGLAVQRGCRNAVSAAAAPMSQRALVRQALARGVGGAGKTRQSASRPGIYR